MNAISLIRKYIDKYLFEPAYTWPKYYFEQQSYSRWAANEILRRVQCQKDTPPILVVEEFILKTDRYSCSDHADKSVGLIFSIAHDVATDILDVLISAHEMR